MARALKKFLAGLLAGALLLASPGLPASRAWAADTRGPIKGGRGLAGAIRRIALTPIRIPSLGRRGTATPKGGAEGLRRAERLEERVAAEPEAAPEETQPASALAGLEEAAPELERPETAAGALDRLFGRFRKEKDLVEPAAEQSPSETGGPEGAPLPRPELGVRAAAKAPPAPRKAAKIEFSQAQRGYLAGQTLYLVAMTLQNSSQALLVEHVTGNIANNGFAQMFVRIGLASTSVLAAYIVSKTDFGRVLRAQSFSRGAVALGIAATSYFIGLPAPVFYGLMALTGFMIAVGTITDIDENGGKVMFPEEAQRNEALRIWMNRAYALDVALPVGLALLMEQATRNLGSGAGAHAAYGALGVALMAGAWMYRKVPPLVSEAAVSLREAFKKVRDTLRDKLLIKGVIMLRIFFRFAAEAFEYTAIPVLAVTVLVPQGLDKNMAVMILISATALGGFLATLGFFKKWAGKLTLGAATVMASLAFAPSMLFWLWPALPLVLLGVMMMKWLQVPLMLRTIGLMYKDPEVAAILPYLYSVLRIAIMAAGAVAGGLFAWVGLNSGPDGMFTAWLGPGALFKVVTGAYMLLALAYGAFYLMMRGKIRELEKTDAPKK